MTDLTRLPSRRDAKIIHAVVECPRGSNLKLKFDPALQAMRMTRPLPAGVTFPADWGFIPSTLAPDDDPLDAIVLHDADAWPGLVIPCRVIGVVLATQRAKKKNARIHNDRVICVPEKAPMFERVKSVTQLTQRVRDEIGHFFEAAVALEEKELQLHGWHGPAKALQILKQCEAAGARRGA